MTRISEESRTQTPPPSSLPLGIGPYFAKRLEQMEITRGHLPSNDASQRFRDAVVRLLESFRTGHSCLPLSPDHADAIRPFSSVLDSVEPGRRPLTPLVLDRSHRLFLQRYYCYECAIAHRIVACKAQNAAPPPVLPISELSSRFSFEGPLDCQVLAVYAGLRNPFTVITGGPGTGKTTVMASILALSLLRDSDCRILLAAPTGKAAKRMKEALAEETAFLHVPDDLKTRLRELPGVTLHKLLGFHPGNHSRKFHAQNPLHADLVVVDECSMLSVEMAAFLCDALPRDVRLILLGDKDQLSSVDTGAVMAELCRAGSKNRLPEPLARDFSDSTPWKIPFPDNAPLSGFIVELHKNHRAKGRTIQKVSETIKHLAESPDSVGEAARMICSLDQPDFRFRALSPSELHDGIKEFLSRPRPVGNQRFSLYELKSLVASGRIAEALELMDKCRILCAVNEGRWGILELNERILRELKLLDPAGARLLPGAPVMILENDPRTELSNGEIGIIRDRMTASFRADDGSLRDVPIVNLPAHQAVFAMTIHKSQGSGFDEVLVILPDFSEPSDLLTRELLYTAVTRAKLSVSVWGSPDVISAMLARPTRRNSGLYDRIGEADNEPEFPGKPRRS